MERLTAKREADAQREAYERRIEQGYPRNIPEERFLRLAAYEDTGLEPEEITDYLPMLREWRQNMGALRHVHEMVKAETEGRLIVLPCKVGELCFRVYSCRCGCRERCKKKKEAKLVDVVPYPCGYAYYCKRIAESKFTLKDISNFGKTVFLTREEAEKALEG